MAEKISHHDESINQEELSDYKNPQLPVDKKGIRFIKANDP